MVDYYESFLTAVDPADLHISVVGYAFYFNPELELLKGHLEQILKNEVNADYYFTEMLAVYINIDNLEISNEHL